GTAVTGLPGSARPPPCRPGGVVRSTTWTSGTRFATSSPPAANGSPRAGRGAVRRGKRRVKGLRREEVAMLAGMSTDYYTRLERGNLTGVSDAVLDALARALHLD